MGGGIAWVHQCRNRLGESARSARLQRHNSNYKNFNCNSGETGERVVILSHTLQTDTSLQLKITSVRSYIGPLLLHRSLRNLPFGLPDTFLPILGS